MKKYKSFFAKIFSIQLIALFLIIFLSALLSLSAISEIIYDKTEKELEDWNREGRERYLTELITTMVGKEEGGYVE